MIILGRLEENLISSQVSSCSSAFFHSPTPQSWIYPSLPYPHQKTPYCKAGRVNRVGSPARQLTKGDSRWGPEPAPSRAAQPMGACGECGAASHWLPAYVHKKERERQAGEHCYLKTLSWCLSLQVKLLRYGARSRSKDTPGCSLGWNPPASEAALPAAARAARSLSSEDPVSTCPGMCTCRARRAPGQVCRQPRERWSRRNCLYPCARQWFRERDRVSESL